MGVVARLKQHGPSLEVLDRCVGCGLCLPACPTYQILGLEMDSPRGRIDFVRALSEGEIPLGPGVVTHLDRCLDCRACESACPSGVSYGQIIEGARAALGRASFDPVWVRLLRGVALRGLLPRPALVRGLGTLLRLWQRTGLHNWLRGRSSLRRLSPSLAWALELAPALDAPAFQPPRRVAAATAPPRQQVSLFRGCVQDVLFPQVGRASLSVLSHCGAEVTVPRAQTCCGALLLHGGERAAALRLAARNVAAFSHAGHEGPIVVTASGCASALKEGAELLGTPRARAFAARIRDVTEVVAELGLPVAPSPLRLKVAYQDPCHLRHACGVTEAPRRMLRSIPQLELVELPDVDTCCGSAGIYNLTQPALSRELMERKVRSVVDSGAQLVASGNPGCLIQLQTGLRSAGVSDRIVALHPIELVARALERSG